jgi:hypothetical protein
MAIVPCWNDRHGPISGQSRRSQRSQPSRASSGGAPIWQSRRNRRHQGWLDTWVGSAGERVHGVARNPGDGEVFLATHQGLFSYDNDAPVPVRVGPIAKIMGF